MKNHKCDLKIEMIRRKIKIRKVAETPYITETMAHSEKLKAGLTLTTQCGLILKYPVRRVHNSFF